MVERDLGSTYLMPQSKLYKPDNRVIIPKTRRHQLRGRPAWAVACIGRIGKGSENYRVLEYS